MRARRVHVRAWPLELINGAPLAVELVGREIDALRASVAPDLFADFDPAQFPHTSMPAFGSAASAYTVNETVGEGVSLAIRDALFEQGRDMADPDVLVEIGARFDVEPFPPSTTEAAVRAD